MAGGVQMATVRASIHVGWYLRFSLSYRDVEELLLERGLSADHVTVWRFSAMPPNWTGGSDHASSPRTRVGASMKPTFA